MAKQEQKVAERENIMQQYKQEDKRRNINL